MIKLFDRVKVNTSTTGTGDITFGSAASASFLTPADAGVLDDDEVRYVIIDGLDFEEGVGLIKDTVATMERTVTKSKIGGTVGTTKINLSGTATVFLSVSAADILTPDDNLSSVSDKAAARTNLGGSTVGNSLFTAADKAAAQSALDIGLVLIASATASNSASVSFDLPSGYAEFLIAVSGAQPATSSNLNLVFGTSGASGSMLTGATDYAYTGFGSAETPGTMFTSNSTGASEIAMTGSTSSGGWVDTWIRINGARNGARMLTAIVDSLYRGTGSGLPFSKLSISGRRTGYSAENACRFSFSSGNIAIGSFKLYGRP
ncbi:MAG: hypothetical protein WBA88_05365 [Pseudaminobacter sp.]